MIKKLALPVLLALGCAALVQSLEAYKSDTRKEQSVHRTVAVAHIVEPPGDCTGECANGYRWGSENAINDIEGCTQLPDEQVKGCMALVRDAASDQLDQF